MAEDGYDPCECVWGHEMAMRRLISILRSSQADCTDTECFTDGSSSTSEGLLGTDPAFFAVVCTVIAMALFFLRPASLRGEGDSKPSNNSNNNFGNGGQPPPPAST